MSPVQASCPACGAPLTFKISSSIVTVCEYCNSVVARGDRQPEDLGKVADLVDTGSPLRIGLRGVYRGTPFELVGRAQFEHEAGGIWDEWYAAFADGRWGWLAEAQGRFYMTFEQALPEGSLIPPFEAVEVGQEISTMSGSVPLIIAEKGVARSLSAKGEIPYRLMPGQEHPYADLSGPGGAFGTLDYSQWPPIIFIGREIPLWELGIPEISLAKEQEGRRVAAVKLSCPKCGGPLELKSPDQAQRVTCQNCSSLLDVNQGQLAFLRALEPRLKPIIPLGSVGKFAEGDLTVIGFLQRSVVLGGVKYYWEEYLLYNPRIGFRWLVRSDDHWNYVIPIPPGEVTEDYRQARLRGKRFKLFQDALARVEHVWGEFYWKVTVGEIVRASDYVRPPEMLSKEVSTTAIEDHDQISIRKRGSKKQKIRQTGEINWSLGLYTKPEEIEAAFGIKGLPRPSNIAPNQPFPHKAIYKYWGILFAAALFLGLILSVISPRKEILEAQYTLRPLQNAEATEVIFTDQFELRSWQNIKVTATAFVNNSWLYIEGDFINDSSGLVEQFSLPVEYYYGVEGGESWSEGGPTASTYLSALPSGKYTLRLEISWQNWNQAMPLRVKVEQGVPRALYLALTLIALSILPALVLIRHYSFERRRWEDSYYSPFEAAD